jgi:serine/threonine protein phosphatase PrpC
MSGLGIDQLPIAIRLWGVSDMSDMSQPVFALAARSAIGLRRSGNEDSAITSANLIAVADGMGGHAGGEVASAIAIKELTKLIPISQSIHIDADSIEDLLAQAMVDIDLEIARVANEEPELRGMGTTLTALLLHEDRIALMHIGDSRAYRLRDGELEQLSLDHTVLQELIDQGKLTIAEANDHPQRSLLTQVLMGSGNLDPVLVVYERKAGDRYLLCSDGLSSVLSNKEIKSLLKKNKREDAVAALVDATYVNDAPDNVTVIVADIATDLTVETELHGASK